MKCSVDFNHIAVLKPLGGRLMDLDGVYARSGHCRYTKLKAFLTRLLPSC